ELNEYGRNTTKISEPAQRLRGAIKSATDPEKAFFEDFITALGFADLKDLDSDQAVQNLVFDLDRSVDEIKNSYNKLIDRIEECILDLFGLKETKYKDYVQIIKNR